MDWRAREGVEEALEQIQELKAAKTTKLSMLELIGEAYCQDLSDILLKRNDIPTILQLSKPQNPEHMAQLIEKIGGENEDGTDIIPNNTVWRNFKKIFLTELECTDFAYALVFQDSVQELVGQYLENNWCRIISKIERQHKTVKKSEYTIAINL